MALLRDAKRGSPNHWLLNLFPIPTRFQISSILPGIWDRGDLVLGDALTIPRWGTTSRVAYATRTLVFPEPNFSTP